jgi:hypothetical protein
LAEVRFPPNLDGKRHSGHGAIADMERGLIHNRLPLCATVRTFMPEFVRVRTIQLLMGCLYTCVGTIALARQPSWALVMFSLASALGSYVTAKLVDNATIPKIKYSEHVVLA